MKKSLVVITVLMSFGALTLSADEAKSQFRVNESAQYKEDAQHKYRHQTEDLLSF